MCVFFNFCTFFGTAYSTICVCYTIVQKLLQFLPQKESVTIKSGNSWLETQPSTKLDNLPLLLRNISIARKNMCYLLISMSQNYVYCQTSLKMYSPFQACVLFMIFFPSFVAIYRKKNWFWINKRIKWPEKCSKSVYKSYNIVYIHEKDQKWDNSSIVYVNPWCPVSF